MKKIILAILILGAVTAALILAYQEMSQERALEAEAEQPIRMESRVERGSSGEVILTLDAPAQQRLALKVAPAAPIRLPRETKAFGRVLDPAPLVGQLADIAANRTALEASRTELQRLKLLYEQGQNTSKRAVDAAEAAVRRDEIAFEGAQLKLVAAWGKALAAHPDLPSLVKSLVAQETALVRLDLPAGEVVATPESARLFPLRAPDQPIPAQLLGPAGDVDAQAQGQSFLFLSRSSDGALRPGEAVVGRLVLPGEPLSGVEVPPSAIIRAAGKAWVYLQTSETQFTRRDIRLDHPTGSGWLIPTGLTSADRLVITGAQMLFSEELKFRVQLGD